MNLSQNHALHLLTEKNVPLKWTIHCQNAFDEWQQCLVSSPVLAYPNYNQHFILKMMGWCSTVCIFLICTSLYIYFMTMKLFGRREMTEHYIYNFFYTSSHKVKKSAATRTVLPSSVSGCAPSRDNNIDTYYLYQRGCLFFWSRHLLWYNEYRFYTNPTLLGLSRTFLRSCAIFCHHHKWAPDNLYGAPLAGLGNDTFQ